MNIEPKLQAIEKEFLDIEERMGDPATASDPRALQDLGKKRAQLEPVVEKYRAYRAAVASIAEARDLLKGGDPEIAELAREELSELEPQIENFEKELTILLLPKDPNDEKSVIVEIRAGVGGGVAPGAAPARGDGRLDDEVTMGREAGVNLVLGVSGLGLQPHRRDHGDPPLAEPGEVVLVRVPGDDVGVVGEPGH